MNILISIKSQDPIYEQIKNQIKANIISGKLASNTQLMSIRTLAKDLQIGVITVKRAYDDLVLEGYIISKEAKGYYVTNIEKSRVKSEALRIIKRKLLEIKEHSKTYNVDKEEIDRLWEDLYHGR